MADFLVDIFTRNVSIKTWDDKLLGLKEEPIKTVIDIGANKGQSTQKLANIFPNSTIYAFEPLAEPFKKLKDLANLNPQIIPYNLALGDTVEKLPFFLHEKSSQSSSFLKITKKCQNDYPILKYQKPIEIQQLTLDGFFEGLSNPLEKEILVKLDVQGYEKKVIKGGSEVLKQASACIVEISVDPVYENQSTFKEVFELLDRLNFNFVGNIHQVKAQTGRIKYFDAVFIKSSC